jgi:hypothetical protein
VVPDDKTPGGSIEMRQFVPQVRFEIWVSVLTSNEYASHKEYFLVYRPDLQEWHQIPTKIENLTTNVEQIFISPEHTIWGLSLEPNPDIPHGSQFVPSQIVFSVFDETSNHFIMQHVQKIPLEWRLSSKAEKYIIYALGKILLDPEGVFWIFSDEDAIYPLIRKPAI